jgi:phosphoglycerate-specific signal transduction histidine kinase
MLPELKTRQIEIHARSAFLQGLLLQPLDQINAYFEPIRPVLEKIPQDRLATALQFVHNIAEIDQVVVGVTSLLNFSKSSRLWHEKPCQLWPISL